MNRKKKLDLATKNRTLYQEPGDASLDKGEYTVIDVPEQEVKVVVLHKMNGEVSISATGYDGEKRGIFYPRPKGLGSH